MQLHCVYNKSFPNSRSSVFSDWNELSITAGKWKFCRIYWQWMLIEQTFLYTLVYSTLLYNEPNNLNVPKNAPCILYSLNIYPNVLLWSSHIKVTHRNCAVLIFSVSGDWFSKFTPNSYLDVVTVRLVMVKFRGIMIGMHTYSALQPRIVSITAVYIYIHQLTLYITELEHLQLSYCPMGLVQEMGPFDQSCQMQLTCHWIRSSPEVVIFPRWVWQPIPVSK